MNKRRNKHTSQNLYGASVHLANGNDEDFTGTFREVLGRLGEFLDNPVYGTTQVGAVIISRVFVEEEGAK